MIIDSISSHVTRPIYAAATYQLEIISGGAKVYLLDTNSDIDIYTEQY